MQINSQQILILASEFPPNTGGLGNHAYNIAKSFTDQGYNVSVVADIIDINQQIIKGFLQQVNFKFYPVARKKFVVLSYIQRIIKAIFTAKKNGIIICSGKFYLRLASILKTFFPHKKFIAVIHGSEIRLLKSAERLLLKFNAIITVSNFTKNLLPRTLQVSSTTFVIPNGINMQEFTGYDIHQPKTGINIVTVGSVTERKGQQNVINALPALLSAYPELQYNIIGKPVIQSQLEKIIDEMGLNDHLKFYGALQRNEMFEVLKNAYVKLMLSNNMPDGDVEGFGIAVLEANALGVPAIGSKNTGIEDAIDNGKTGFIVNAKNADEILKAFSTIMGDYDFYSANALEWAWQHDWKVIIKKYEEVIAFVMK